jgi:hypothetical protein
MLNGKNNKGELPLQLARSYSSRIRKCIKLFVEIQSKFNKEFNNEEESNNQVDKQLQNGTDNKPILLSLDGGGIKGLVLIRVVHFCIKNSKILFN